MRNLLITSVSFLSLSSQLIGQTETKENIPSLQSSSAKNEAIAPVVDPPELKMNSTTTAPTTRSTPPATKKVEAPKLQMHSEEKAVEKEK
jgi:hypothetical protein